MKYSGQVGISIYLSTGLVKNLEILQTAKKNRVSSIFTSFNIPEESVEQFSGDIKEITSYCHNNNIDICADVSDRTIHALNLKSIEDLYDFGITCLRMDYGIEDNDIINCTKKHKIMINASTIRKEELELYKQKEISFDNVVGCHNFYPKINTGLSKKFVIKQNKLLNEYGIETIAFIPGNKKLRGPLFEKLPTCEVHRNDDVLKSAIELKFYCGSDSIFVGDVECEEYLYPLLHDIVDDIIPLKTAFTNKIYEKMLVETVFQNRYDLSENTIRCQESRINKKYALYPEPDIYNGNIEKGDIIVSNTDFKRYVNEIEIAKKQLPHDSRVNIIGKIQPQYIDCIDFIISSSRFKCIK